MEMVQAKQRRSSTSGRGMKRSLSTLAAAAGAIVLTTSPAAAASGTWASGGVSGVHAQGTWKTEYSRLYFSGYVRDTSCDGRNVKLKVEFSTVHAGVPIGYRSETVTNTSGCGTNRSFNYRTYTPGLQTQVRIKECIIKTIDTCSSWALVASATP